MRSAGVIAIAGHSTGRPPRPALLPDGPRTRLVSAAMGERRGSRYLWRTVPRAPTALFQTVTGVHPAMVQVMYSRGLASPELCADFLAGVCRDPDEPTLLKDVPEAVARLVRARDAGDRV